MLFLFFIFSIIYLFCFFLSFAFVSFLLCFLELVRGGCETHTLHNILHDITHPHPHFPLTRKNTQIKHPLSPTPPDSRSRPAGGMSEEGSFIGQYGEKTKQPDPQFATLV